ncbi:MAG: tetraacyldisaccharide 4'-kinase [Burkholderiales bacterium]|nr:tetraacyldisaccharide 4'-kinase [Burkholderiales bacterium]
MYSPIFFAGSKPLRTLIETVLMRTWQKRGVLACLLWPLAKLFQLLVTFRFALYVLGYKLQTRLPVPVVVVGNIFIGGTGKTPLVIWLVQQLQAAGWQPGVISRAYGAAADRVIAVTPASAAAEVGDEPLLIALRSGCPVVVGRDRVAAARALLAAHPDTDVIISDDGLQHYALGRDVEIVLFDQRGAGNGWLLPAGPLREPLRRRRDFTVLNAAPDAVPPALTAATIRMHLQPQDIYRLGDPRQRQPLAELTPGRERIVAAAGIGNPQRFFDMLSAAGLQFSALPLPDHHVFQAQTFAGLDAERILITEKDAVKCRQIAALHDDARIWVVPVAAQPDAGFAAPLIQMISEKKHGRSLA